MYEITNCAIAFGKAYPAQSGLWRAFRSPALHSTLGSLLLGAIGTCSSSVSLLLLWLELVQLELTELELWRCCFCCTRRACMTSNCSEVMITLRLCRFRLRGSITSTCPPASLCMFVNVLLPLTLFQNANQKWNPGQHTEGTASKQTPSFQTRSERRSNAERCSALGRASQSVRLAPVTWGCCIMSSQLQTT